MTIRSSRSRREIRGADQGKQRGAGWTRTTGLRIMSPPTAISLPAETGPKGPVTCRLAADRIGSFLVVSRALAAPLRPRLGLFPPQSLPVSPGERTPREEPVRHE